ncbi:hypothetical protein E4S40_00905 [Algoriphagus kandeliae]|uniref:Glycosyltransferase RgtA/B/C/D-like domain-containing protein n=1 Tax=Algoriphagus kandeliae TaxID=2562278 RepID=A0A4Y9QYS0_9BACT|nr:hypothetical protein [Algoriphagus kandeliae]TFV97247.1 hypothetical protein E4S40_00905 [Algoriphagus kandeliae]
MPKFLLGASILAIAIVLAGINRGFDVSDEGLYVLLAHPFQENQGGIFNYDLFFKLIYEWTGIHFGIVGLRVLRLVFYALGACGLTSFYQSINPQKSSFNKVYFLSFLGLLAGYGFLPASLSYNHLTVVLTCFWLAFIAQPKWTWINSILIGLVLAVLVYVKVTTSILLGGISLIIIFWIQKRPWYHLLALILPFLVLELIFHWTLGENAISRLSEGIAIQGSRGDYQFWILIKHTLVGLLWSLLIFGAVWLVRRSLKNQFLQLAIVLPIFIFLFFKTKITDEWNHFFLLLVAGIWAFTFNNLSSKSKRERRLPWIVLLIFLPFILHLGSNVYWLRLGIHYAVFWILGIYLLLDDFPEKLKSWFGIGISLMTLLLVFNGIWWHPFEQKSLWYATQQWKYLPRKYIQLVPSQIEELQKLKKEVGEESQLLAAYRISGIPYLLGRTMPKSPGFWDKAQLEYYFPQGYSKDMLYFPLDSLSGNFTNKPILLQPFE